MRKKGEGEGEKGEGEKEKGGKKEGKRRKRLHVTSKIFRGLRPRTPLLVLGGLRPPQTPPYDFTTRRDSLLNPLFLGKKVPPKIPPG